MNQFCSTFRRLGLNLVVVAMLALPEMADAQFFNYTPIGDVLAGFRKTGVYAGNFELVVDLGSVTNFLNLSAGSTITISNVTFDVLTNSFASGFGHLQWSVFAAATQGQDQYTWVTPVGTFPPFTIWYTLPGTNVTTQTQPPTRDTTGGQSDTRAGIVGVGSGARSISGYLNTTNAYNYSVLVREPVAYGTYDLTAFIGDYMNSAIGDFGAGGSPLPYIVENTTPSSFTAAQRDDFYQLCPYGYVDPITGSTNDTYFVGYFILNPNGTMAFTRASATVAPPTAGSVSGSATNGFAGLTVVLTNTASGSITNWVWNFGNGTIITNTTGGNVTNTYASAGSYTVTLAVYGPGGSSTNIMASYIVTSPAPKFTQMVLQSGGKFVFGGTNCPAGVQYRILTTTNVALAATNWIPVLTNTFPANGSYFFTNAVGNTNLYFRMVSP